MQLRGPAPHVVHLHRAQGHRLRGGQVLQARQCIGVERQRARRESAFDLQVQKMALHVFVKRSPRIRLRRSAGGAPTALKGPLRGPWGSVNGAPGGAHQLTGSRRDSAALEISPMRIRKSVPMSAL